MSVFVISDLHLSFGVDKPMDVFGAHWQGFEKRLEENWRRKIKPCDTVVLPGDLSWGMSLSEARADFAFLDALPGQKILLKGNHDYYWNTVSKLDAFLTEEGFSTIRFLHNNAFLCEGLILAGSRGWVFDETAKSTDKKILDRECARFALSLSSAKALKENTQSETEIVVFSHYPLSAMFCRHPLLDLLKDYGVKRVYYGHLHQTSPSQLPPSEEDGISFTLVSSDHLNFDPLKIS